MSHIVEISGALAVIAAAAAFGIPRYIRHNRERVFVDASTNFGIEDWWNETTILHIYMIGDDTVSFYMKDDIQPRTVSTTEFRAFAQKLGVWRR